MLFFVSHIFRMTTFFVIAGYFGRMLRQRRGTGDFLRNRLTRIVVPFLVFWPVVTVAIAACKAWGAATMSRGASPSIRTLLPPLSAKTIPLTHLWFLYVLSLFYAATLILRGLAALIDRSGRFRAGPVDRAMRLLLATPAAAPLLAAPLAIVLALQPGWFALSGIPTPGTGLIPNPAAVIGFGTAFAFGWLLQRQRGLLVTIQRWWAIQLAAAIVFTMVCAWKFGSARLFGPPPPFHVNLIYAACYALAAWAWTLGLIGAALRYLASERPAIRYVADASYWIYLVHLPLVMALQILLFPLHLPAIAKYLVVTCSALLLLLLSYEWLVRHSFMGQWLNGRKYPRARRENPAAAAVAAE